MQLKALPALLSSLGVVGSQAIEPQRNIQSEVAFSEVGVAGPSPVSFTVNAPVPLEDATVQKINIKELNVFKGPVNIYETGKDGEVQHVVMGEASPMDSWPLNHAQVASTLAIHSKSAKASSPSTKSSKATISPTSSPSSPPVWRRILVTSEEGVREDIPRERRLEIIAELAHLGAKTDAMFSSVYDLISPESCDALIKFMDEALADAMVDEANIPVGTSDNMENLEEAWNEFAQGGTDNQFNKKLNANDLVQLIGREETLKIIDFFEESLGNLTIDCLYLARHGWNGNDQYLSPWHKDDYATMEITLNNNYEGGHVLHMNADGVHKTDARPGSATAHKTDIVHGITPNVGGPKYMLIAKHHFDRPDKEGVVRLSKEIVDAIGTNA